jgi:hypothetical protein
VNAGLQGARLWCPEEAIRADAFSKKLENHVAATALHFAYYNLVRVHETLETTPAPRPGLACTASPIDVLTRCLGTSTGGAPADR